ncbi:MAG TPA: hypothetical protein PKN22_08485 [Taishania sp.]|nr:hypothetical protein [Taishania sp.]
MKKYHLFLLLLIASTTLYGQANDRPQQIKLTDKKDIKATQQPQTKTTSNSTTTENSSNSNSQSYPISYTVDAAGNQETMDKAFYERQLEGVNDLIEAIDYKVEYVKSNPEENAKALNSGWYEQMKRSRINAENRKLEIQEKIQSFK